MKEADSVDAGCVEFEGRAFVDRVSQHFNRVPEENQGQQSEDSVQNRENGHPEHNMPTVLNEESDDHVDQVGDIDDDENGC